MKNKEYDYLIVGSGLFGAVFAHEATKAGKKCMVIDKCSHKGGNIFCENIEGINVHTYGAHIFHTSNKKIWDYINQFSEFNHYINSPLAHSNGRLYNLPFNMNTFNQLWGVKTPVEARNIINQQIKESKIDTPSNLEEKALSLVGHDVYEKFVKYYTEKQWGRAANSLPAFIIKRIPLRFTYNNNYFNDIYQGIPIRGYNSIIDKMLLGIEVRIDSDFFKNRKYYESLSTKIVYTGKIDEFYNFKFGHLEYRSLKFVNEVLDVDNYQGNAVINYCDADTPFTRIIEHKHFEFGNQKKTVITKECSIEGKGSSEPYYPINDSINMAKFKRYQLISEMEPNVIFGGRLAEYKYYDMHQIIASALNKAKYEHWD